MKPRGEQLSRGQSIGWLRGEGFLVVLLGFSLALTACTTCVSGKVSMEGVPLQGVTVQLLDAQGVQIGYTATDQDGQYCFENVPIQQAVTVLAWEDGVEASKTITTGTQVAFCETSGLCTQADLTLACEVDALEPNNNCATASVVSLPYSNPLAGLCPLGDVDFYSFEVTEGNKALVARTYYPGSGKSLDSFIGLLDSQCNILATNDDSGGTIYSLIGYTLPGPGTYYVAVTRYGDWQFQGSHNDFGTYGLDIQLTEPSCISVRVTEQGQPLSGAWIYSLSGQMPCQTDSSGVCCFSAYQGLEASYTICHPVTGECVQVSATPALAGSCGQGGCEELAFDFSYTCVSGIVTREGIPVENAWVSSSFGYQSVATGPDGSFCLIARQETEGCIYVQDPILSETQEQCLLTGAGGKCAEGGCTEVDIALKGITCVSGTVMRGDELAEGVSVCSQVDCIVTGPDGRYCVKAAAESDIHLYVNDPVTNAFSEEPVTTGVSGSCEEGGCTTHDVQLPGAACINGTITRQGGEPAPSIQVCGSPSGCVTTDQEGRYCLREPVETNVTVNIYDPVIGVSYSEGITTEEAGSCMADTCTELNYELPPVACVSGTVTRGSEAEAGAKVCVGHIDNLCTATDSQGSYCLLAPVASDASIWVKDPILGQWQYNYIGTGAAGSCGLGQCTAADFQLPEATCISGVVREGTEPLPGAKVFNEFSSVETGTDGLYCLPAVANEKQPIQAVHPVDGSYIRRYPTTGNGGKCDQGGCTTQNFTFDLKVRR